MAHMLFCRDEMSVWALMLFCCTIFVRDVNIRMRWGEELVLVVFRMFFLKSDVMTVKRCVLKEAGNWVYTMVFGRWWWLVVGVNANALGDRRVCVEIIWVVLPSCMTSSRDVRMFEGDVRMLKWCKAVHSGGGGWGGLFGLVGLMRVDQTILARWSDGSSFDLSCSCALTVHVISLLVFATVFLQASAFNGDLNQWDVASVTTMFGSKSIRVV